MAKKEDKKLSPIEKRIAKAVLKIGRRIPGAGPVLATKLNSALAILNQAQAIPDSSEAIKLISLAERILKVRE